MGKDASEIRTDIEQTRARMGDTVEALSYKTDVKARVGDAVSDRVETVKGTIGDAAATAQSALQGAAVTAKDTVSDVLSGARTTLNGAKTTVGKSLSAAGDSVSGLATNAPSSDDVKSGVQRGIGIVAKNPLGLVVGALAAGALVGLFAPVTDYERETVGPIRDDLVDRASAIGADALEHGRAVLNETAQTAVQTAQQSVRTQGTQVLNGELTPDALASSVVTAGKAILHDTVAATLQTAQQSAETHGRQVVAHAQGQSQSTS